MLRLAAAAMTLAMLLTAGCRRTPSAVESGVAAVDFPIAVRGVTIEKAPGSVAVYSDSLADAVMNLTSAEQLQLTARSADSAYSGIAMLPAAGTAAKPDVPQLQSLGVQLVLTDTPPSETAAASLAEAGIPVLVLEPATDRESLIELYRALGSALSGGRTGYTLGQSRAEKLLMALDDVRRAVPEPEEVLVSGYVLDETGCFATDQTLAGQLFDYVRAVNLAADTDTLTADELALANPSVLFCAEGLRDMLKSDARFAALDAVKSDRVIEIPLQYMTGQGLSLVEGAIRLASALYPSLDFRDDPVSSSAPASSDASSDPSSAADHPASVNAQSSRADILTLQDRLIALGYMQPPGDGLYGYWTKACIKEFQRRAGLPQTGIADEKTMTALYADDAPRG